MATLIVRDGPPGQAGRRFVLDQLPAVIGRDPDVEIALPSKLVSRRHACVSFEGGQFYIEDLDSRNGVLLNGERITGKKSFTEQDKVRIVDFVLALEQPAPGPALVDRDQRVRQQVNADTANLDLYSLQSSHKLQVVLQLSRHLSLAADRATLFEQLLQHLLELFPRADRGVVVLCEKDKFLVEALKTRNKGAAVNLPISRTIVRKALDEGLGILSEDIHSDERFASGSSLEHVDIRTLLCVPMIGHEGGRLGALQLTSARFEDPFVAEDLHLLTTIGMQAAMVLENLSLQEERIQQAQLRKELAMAREIQQSFLPVNFTPIASGSYELFAVIYPAREVSGDLYDFFPLDDGRLAFFVGDVSGKGMSAALFMVAAHVLTRHLAMGASSPAATLAALNNALVRDNQAGMFVTMLHGIIDPQNGATWLSSGGHPRPLHCRRDGAVAEVSMQTGRLLGAENGELDLSDTGLKLEPGETLILYTDGVTEARAADGPMFGRDRLCQLLGGLRTTMSLEAWAERIRLAVELYSGSASLQDDLTLLLLRRG
jgi:sigma-B regulation protein RsbU (phosphoserine phosphatase)